jgi:hypothetical protein
MPTERELLSWFTFRFGSLPHHACARVIMQTEEYAVVEQLLADGESTAFWLVRYKSRLWTCWPLRERGNELMTLAEAD